METSDLNGQKLLHVDYLFCKDADALICVDLHFEENILSLSINDDTDELVPSLESHLAAKPPKVSTDPFSQYYNQQLMLSWQNINSRGYLDALALAFTYCRPNLLIFVEAGSFRILALHDVSPKRPLA